MVAAGITERPGEEGALQSTCGTRLRGGGLNARDARLTVSFPTAPGCNTLPPCNLTNRGTWFF
jgi:hypothetical protein